MTEFKSCDEATDHWNEDWHVCPVCGALPSADGLFVHKDPDHLIN